MKSPLGGRSCASRPANGAVIRMSSALTKADEAIRELRYGRKAHALTARMTDASDSRTSRLRTKRSTLGEEAIANKLAANLNSNRLTIVPVAKKSGSTLGLFFAVH